MLNNNEENKKNNEENKEENNEENDVEEFSENDDDDDDTIDTIDTFNIIEDKRIKNQITDCLCNMIEYIVAIPTLFYSIYWIKAIENCIPKDNIYKYKKENLKEKNPPICYNLLYWKDWIIFLTKFNIGRAFLFIGTAKICGVNKKDQNFFCIMIKEIISLIISIGFVFKLKKEIKKFKSEGRKSIFEKEIKEVCENLYHKIQIFSNCELYYIYFIFFLCLFFIIIMVLMGLKEAWKGRGYKDKLNFNEFLIN